MQYELKGKKKKSPLSPCRVRRIKMQIWIQYYLWWHTNECITNINLRQRSFNKQTKDSKILNIELQNVFTWWPVAAHRTSHISWLIIIMQHGFSHIWFHSLVHWEKHWMKIDKKVTAHNNEMSFHFKCVKCKGKIQILICHDRWIVGLSIVGLDLKCKISGRSKAHSHFWIVYLLHLTNTSILSIDK